MRLSDILSNQTIVESYQQIDGFLHNRTLRCGRCCKVEIGKIAINCHCKNCGTVMSFASEASPWAVGVDDRTISIDCVLKCARCGEKILVWFLVESEQKMAYPAPKVKVIKRSLKVSDNVTMNEYCYGELSKLLDKADRAYGEGLGAGAMVYLRKLLEQVAINAAKAADIELKDDKGRRKKFNELLKEIDQKNRIVPSEFSDDGYKLFGELSNVVHANNDEEEALQKYKLLRRLIVGILDNIRRNVEKQRSREELEAAFSELGWDMSENT